MHSRMCHKTSVMILLGRVTNQKDSHRNLFLQSEDGIMGSYANCFLRELKDDIMLMLEFFCNPKNISEDLQKFKTCIDPQVEFLDLVIRAAHVEKKIKFEATFQVC